MKVSVEEALLKMMTCRHQGEDRPAVAEGAVQGMIAIGVTGKMMVSRMTGIDVEIESEREKDGSVIETEKGTVTDIAIENVIESVIAIGIVIETVIGIAIETVIGIVTEIVKEIVIGIVTGIAIETVIGIAIMVGSMKEIAIGIVIEEVEEITIVTGTGEESKRRWFIKDGTDSKRLFTNC